MIIKKIHITFLFIIFFTYIGRSQVPTVQDCMGAIPICQNVYSTTTSYHGMGNYPNEVSLNNCLYLGGESNSVWYVFTVQNSGLFRFVLTPNSSYDDYDWAVFNLTNYSCSNIYSTPSMMVSCNASGYTGPTGISTPMGGSGNSNGPNWTNKFNQDLPVQAGETYVLMISNWSNGYPGYTIDFSSSTAQIFDNVAPSINQITTNINCGASSLTFNFSENILCSTISTCDLTLTGPGGPYTITGISGNGCNVGGKQEKTFTVTFTPPITTGGSFSLNLNASACGSVTDLCGNVAPSGSLPFTINLVNATVNTTVAACATPNGTATAVATGGTGNYTYLWNTNPPQTTATISNLYAGTYTVTVYDGSCSSVATGVVGTTSNMTATITNVVNATCNIANGSATVNITGGTQPLSYQWNTSPVQTLATVSNLFPGTYTVTVTDANQCTITANAIITQLNPPPSANITGTNVLCYGNSTGAANLTVTGGTTPFTYLWSNGATTQNLSNIPSGTYSVTVTDAAKCTATSSIVISQPAAPLTVNVSPTHILCNGNSTGAASANVSGGTAPYSYTWSNGATTQTIQNLSAGNYSIIVSDKNNCTVNQSISINEPPSLTFSLATVDVLCNGTNTGSANITVTGGTPPYNYTWQPTGIAGNSPNATNLYAGSYSVSVTDNNNCTVNASFTINEPPLLTVSYTSKDVNCFGGNDGNINISTSGGTQPIFYNWSPNVSSSNIADNLVAGIYSVTVSDNKGCNTVLQININQPPILVLTTTGNDTVCYGTQVSFGASATGGTPPYVYNWDNGLGNGNSFSVTANTTTAYNVTVTDAHLCQIPPQSLTIYVRDLLTVNVSALPDRICEGSQTSLTAVVNGGEPPYSYIWDNSSLSGSTASITPLQTSVFNITVTDNCGSPAAFDSVTVTVFPVPVISFTADKLSGCEPLLVNFTGLTSAVVQNWIWNFGDPASNTANTSNLQNPSHIFQNSGTYSISLTAITADGCKNTYTISNMIEVYPNPIAMFSATPNPASTSNATVVFYDQSINASSWLWTFGDAGSASNSATVPNPTHTYSGSGNYNVSLVVESYFGCIDSTSTVIKVNEDFAFWVPSAFTPNDDGINDIFRPKGINVNPDSYNLYIYDRWGKEIFISSDINYGWDGTIYGSDKLAPQGVYVWVIRFNELNEGMVHSYIGRVTLIK